MPVATPRPTCIRCRRPATACWCAGLAPVRTATRVVFLQHPRESRVAIGTARLAHLGLANSELHEGIDFRAHPRVQELAAQPGTVLLFPGGDAVDPTRLERPPDTLLILDGTWSQARKLLALNPHLHSLPRVGLVPRRPGNYRIRREPAPHCLATVEAVIEVLATWEEDEARFSRLRQAFESMVDRQIAAPAARTEPVRRRLKPAPPWWESAGVPDLAALWPHLVAVAAEANAHRRGSGIAGEPELLQLTAVRPATGEVFQAFAAPRRPLAPSAAHHLEVPPSLLEAGRPIGGVVADWSRFCRPDDRLVGWGGFSWELLAREGWQPPQDPIDLRGVVAHRLRRRPGSVQAAALAIGAGGPDVPPAPGRAGRTVHALVALLARLREELTQDRRPCPDGHPEPG